MYSETKYLLSGDSYTLDKITSKVIHFTVMLIKRGKKKDEQLVVLNSAYR